MRFNLKGRLQADARNHSSSASAAAPGFVAVARKAATLAIHTANHGNPTLFYLLECEHGGMRFPEHRLADAYWSGKGGRTSPGGAFQECLDSLVFSQDYCCRKSHFLWTFKLGNANRLRLFTGKPASEPGSRRNSVTGCITMKTLGKLPTHFFPYCILLSRMLLFHRMRHRGRQSARLDLLIFQ